MLLQSDVPSWQRLTWALVQPLLMGPHVCPPATKKPPEAPNWVASSPIGDHEMVGTGVHVNPETQRIRGEAECCRPRTGGIAGHGDAVLKKSSRMFEFLEAAKNVRKPSSKTIAG